MNRVTLIGRLTRDPDVKYTQGIQPMVVAHYTLAVDRPYAKDREQTADFINCVAFGKNGEFAKNYLHKGTKIAIEGRIQTGSYTDKEGRKVYTTDIVVEHHEFCESRGNGNGGNNQPAPDADGFTNIPDNVDSDILPFN